MTTVYVFTYVGRPMAIHTKLEAGCMKFVLHIAMTMYKVIQI
jgi:hypothetical protein